VYRETLKSIALFVLVGLSLFLSGRFWFGEGPYSAADQEGYYALLPEEVQVKDLQQLVAPARIVVHTGGGSHVMFLPGFSGYEKVWEETWRETRRMLSELTYPEPGAEGTAGPGEVGALRSGEGFEFLFPLSLPFDLWLDIWEVQTDGSPPEIVTDRLLLFAGDRPAVYVKKGDAQKYLELELKSFSPSLSAIMEELREARLPEYVSLGPAEGIRVADGVYVPREPPYLAPLRVRIEAGDPDRIAVGFFGDLSVVRRIEERDGAVVYTDGRKALRVHPNGGTDFSASPPSSGGEAEGVDALTVLRRAVDFVTFHGGWPEQSYLAEVLFPPLSPIRQGGDGYSFSYSSRFTGYPLIGPDEPISATVRGGRVVRYRRLARVPIGAASAPQPTLPADKALKVLADRPGSPAGTEGFRVEDMYLAYFAVETDGSGSREQVLRPVWVIEAPDDRTCYIDALTGEGWTWTGQGPRRF